MSLSHILDILMAKFDLKLQTKNEKLRINHTTYVLQIKARLQKKTLNPTPEYRYKCTIPS